MEIKINRKDFLKILTKAKYLTSSKTNLAITSTVLLIAENDKLEIQATDLEVFYQDFCSSKIIQPGCIAVPLKELYNFVQKIKSHEIYLTLKDTYWLKISGEAIHLNIVCMNSDDFPIMPAMPELNYDKMIKIKTIDLKEMIDKVVIVSNNEEIYKTFKHGVQFKTIKQDNKNFIRMVSTNGEQLNLIDKECPDALKLELNKGTLIPKKDLLKLNKMLLQTSIKAKNKINPFFENEDCITLGINQNYFIIKKLNVTIIIRLLKGEFPDYDDLIFKQDKNIIIIDKKIFLDAIQQIKIMQNKDYNTMLINIENNILKMFLQNPDMGEIEKTINIEYTGKLIEARFSLNQFANLLNVMNSEKIELNINNGITPCMITGDQDKYFYGLIMPFK